MNPRTLYLIKRTEIEASSQMSKALEQHSITPIQFTVLYFVDFNKGDLSSAQLSRRFLMTPQSMSELITVLEKKKLLKKSADPINKRILRISLTSKGKKIVEDSSKILDKVEDELLEGLLDEEKVVLKKILYKILDTSRIPTLPE